MDAQSIYIFLRNKHNKLGKISQRFQETGILLMYQNTMNYISTLNYMMSLRDKIRLELQLFAVPFAITDPKILSVFVGCTVLLVITLSAFLMEIQLFNCKEYFNQYFSLQTVRKIPIICSETVHYCSVYLSECELTLDVCIRTVTLIE